MEEGSGQVALQDVLSTLVGLDDGVPDSVVGDEQSATPFSRSSVTTPIQIHFSFLYPSRRFPRDSTLRTRTSRLVHDPQRYH